MKAIEIINFVIMLLFFLCYFYQMIYTVIPFIKRKSNSRKSRSDDNRYPLHRFAVMIAARNEESVIGQLIESIHSQDYPCENVDIYVVADNCTDNTAEICRKAGATVFERENKFQVGKGYALQFLTAKIRACQPMDYYDGYFIFDADNLLDEHYISEMNAVFSRGARIITSCRNSKNFAENWVAAGYGIWFLRESQVLNFARETLGTSSIILGTGFLFHKDILNREDGWNYLLMSEDMEFTVDNVLKGETIHYCDSAVIYDEQPVSFSQSFTQRARWVKGYLQVFGKYGGKLLRGIFAKRSFACFDISMSIIPAMFLTILSTVVGCVAAIAELIKGTPITSVLLLAVSGLVSSYTMFLFIGALVVIRERKSIHCPTIKLLLYTLAFPLFMLTYIPIAIYANFSKVTWKPIEHNRSVTLEEVRRL